MYHTKVSQVIFSSLICGCLVQSILKADGVLPMDTRESSVEVVPVVLEAEAPQLVSLPVKPKNENPPEPQAAAIMVEPEKSKPVPVKKVMEPKNENPPEPQAAAIVVEPETSKPMPVQSVQEPKYENPPVTQSPAVVEEPQKSKPMPVNEEMPIPAVKGSYLNIRQMERGGVGYTQGYTTIETFLTPFRNIDTWLPYLDLRGHRFDNGKYAANVGLGFRALASCALWGANVYYDYRQTRHQDFNQMGVGLEALTAHWDFRINGYIPVGRTHSHLYDTRFGHFRGNRLILKTKQIFDMGGLNAEMAYHWIPTCNVDVTAAIGPYYFKGKFNKQAGGAQARLKATFLNTISLEGIGSYDSLFKWKGQGQLTFSVPLAPKIKNRGIAKDRCNNSWSLSRRFAQPVQRFEIIVADVHKEHKTAINPVTGAPFNFIFVNNDPPTDPNGTFEHPFLILDDANDTSAPNDIIYVYGSDILYTPETAGRTIFTMQQGQKLWGSGIKHHLHTTLGGINIPAATTLFPSLSNGPVAPHSIIILADNTEVAGFNFPAIDTFPANTIGGIAGVGITNATIQHNNLVLASTMSATQGMFFQNCGGEIVIKHNSVVDSNGNGFRAVVISLDSPPPATYLIHDNEFTSLSPFRGLFPDILFNRFSGTSNPNRLIVKNNTFVNWGFGVDAGFSANAGDLVQVIQNTFTQCQSTGPISFANVAPGTAYLEVLNNRFDTSGVSQISSEFGGDVVARFNGNTATNTTELNTVEVETFGGGSSVCIQINDNVLDKPVKIQTFGGGIVNLEEPKGNVGEIDVINGTIVPAGTCE